MTATLIRVDFQNKKVIGKHQLGERVKTFHCKSCGESYDVKGSVKGIDFGGGFVVCSVCVAQANDMLNGGVGL